MARKTFISYKHSESQDLRDKIINSLGDDGTYYKGETVDSPDQTDNKTETIKKNLTDMIFDTSVTIVIVSPNMNDSKWIPWEIEYSLKENTRDGRTSQRNGIVGVVAKYDADYTWMITEVKYECGCINLIYDDLKFHEIIKKNIFNLKEKKYACIRCRSLSMLYGSYISLIKEDDFLRYPNEYIENAYEKSQKIDKYNIIIEAN